MADTDRLALAAHRSRVILVKDERIRSRPAERRTLIDYEVMAFFLLSETFAHIG